MIKFPSRHSRVPVGVKVLAGIVIFKGVFGGIFALLTITGLIPAFSAASRAFMILYSLGLMSLAVFDIFMGRGLWKGQNWARIAAIVFLAIPVLLSVFVIIFGAVELDIQLISGLAVSLFLIYYLGFNKEVKDAFSR